MTRQLTITTIEAPVVLAAIESGEPLWLVREGTWDAPPDTDVLAGEPPFRPAPPAEFVQACAPCEMCGDAHVLGWERIVFGGDVGEVNVPCTHCRIELVGPCPECQGTGHIPADLSRNEFWHCETCGGTNTVSRRRCGFGRRTLGHGYAIGGPLPIIAEADFTHERQTGNQSWIIVSNPLRPSAHIYPKVVMFLAGVEDGIDLTAVLAHYGPPESLVGKWALRVQVVA